MAIVFGQNRRCFSMIHSVKIGLILLGLALAPIEGSAQVPACNPASADELKQVKTRYGNDPATVVRHVTLALHKHFLVRSADIDKNHFLSDGDLQRQQMAVLFNNFALPDWLKSLNGQSPVKSMQPISRYELEYLFSHWVRSRYMKTVASLIKSREKLKVDRELAETDPVRRRVINSPAETIVTGYQPFQCETLWDRRAYNCGNNMVKVHAQMSPRVLCQTEDETAQGHFVFLVDVSTEPFRIVDVEFEKTRVYQDAYIDLNSMLGRTKAFAEMTDQLKMWSFLPLESTSEMAIQQFRKQYNGSIIPRRDRQDRLPASK